MSVKTIGAAVMLSLMVSLAGCKEDKPEVSNPDCSNPEMANHSKCIRTDENIIRSKPKTWTMDNSEN
ncbi:hypothetical protein ABOC32_28995 (plasmid) [Pseudomonas sp. WOUb67]|uniref:hypothetical protein n=1 Tax=Pseudomonas sp. WOUb67 TaxID=3161136 RepID=UPI003CF47393